MFRDAASLRQSGVCSVGFCHFAERREGLEPPMAEAAFGAGGESFAGLEGEDGEVPASAAIEFFSHFFFNRSRHCGAK